MGKPQERERVYSKARIHSAMGQEVEAGIRKLADVGFPLDQFEETRKFYFFDESDRTHWVYPYALCKSGAGPFISSGYGLPWVICYPYEGPGWAL